MSFLIYILSFQSTAIADSIQPDPCAHWGQHDYSKSPTFALDKQPIQNGQLSNYLVAQGDQTGVMVKAEILPNGRMKTSFTPLSIGKCKFHVVPAQSYKCVSGASVLDAKAQRFVGVIKADGQTVTSVGQSTTLGAMAALARERVECEFKPETVGGENTYR